MKINYLSEEETRQVLRTREHALNERLCKLVDENKNNFTRLAELRLNKIMHLAQDHAGLRTVIEQHSLPHLAPPYLIWNCGACRDEFIEIGNPEALFVHQYGGSWSMEKKLLYEETLLKCANCIQLRLSFYEKTGPQYSKSDNDLEVGTPLPSLLKNTQYQATPLYEFTCFSNLPSELRLKIWTFTFEKDTHPTTHNIGLRDRFRSGDYHSKDPGTWLVGLVNAVRRTKELGLYSNHRTPHPALAACSESRAHYLLATGRVFAYGTYINFRTDVIKVDVENSMCYELAGGGQDYPDAVLSILLLFFRSRATRKVQHLAIPTSIGAHFGFALSCIDFKDGNKDPITGLHTILPQWKQLLVEVDREDLDATSISPDRTVDENGFWDLSSKERKFTTAVANSKYWLYESYDEGSVKGERISKLLDGVKYRYVTRPPWYGE